MSHEIINLCADEFAGKSCTLIENPGDIFDAKMNLSLMIEHAALNNYYFTLIKLLRIASIHHLYVSSTIGRCILFVTSRRQIYSLNTLLHHTHRSNMSLFYDYIGKSVSISACIGWNVGLRLILYFLCPFHPDFNVSYIGFALVDAVAADQFETVKILVNFGREKKLELAPYIRDARINSQVQGRQKLFEYLKDIEKSMGIDLHKTQRIQINGQLERCGTILLKKKFLYKTAGALDCCGMSLVILSTKRATAVLADLLEATEQYLYRLRSFIALALIKASSNGYDDVVNLIILRCSSVIPVSVFGEAMRHSVAGGHKAVLRMIISFMCDTSMQFDAHLQVSILEAASKGYLDIIETLSSNAVAARYNFLIYVPQSIFLAKHNGHTLCHDKIIKYGHINSKTAKCFKSLVHNQCEDDTRDESSLSDFLINFSSISTVNFGENIDESEDENMALTGIPDYRAYLSSSIDDLVEKISTILQSFHAEQ